MEMQDTVVVIVNFQVYVWNDGAQQFTTNLIPSLTVILKNINVHVWAYVFVHILHAEMRHVDKRSYMFFRTVS